MADQFSLALGAVALGVEAEFRNHQWPIAGDMLEAQQVSLEGRFVLEVDVEGAEVRIAGFQIFGARKVGVGEEQVRGELPAQSDQVLQRGLHPRRTHPAHQVSRYFIADIDARQGGLFTVFGEPLGELDFGCRETRALAQKV